MTPEERFEKLLNYSDPLVPWNRAEEFQGYLGLMKSFIEILEEMSKSDKKDDVIKFKNAISEYTGRYRLKLREIDGTMSSVEDTVKGVHFAFTSIPFERRPLCQTKHDDFMKKYDDFKQKVDMVRKQISDFIHKDWVRELRSRSPKPDDGEPKV